MFVRTLRGAVALAAAGCALVTPNAAQAESVWAGFTCGYSSSNDPTGQVVQDPNTQTGVVTAGPFTATHNDGTPAYTVTLVCTFQINASNHGAGGVSRSSTTSGNVGVLADTISYTATPGDDVYLCTAFWWCDSKGCWHVEYDDNADATDGNQCSLSTSIEAR